MAAKCASVVHARFFLRGGLFDDKFHSSLFDSLIKIEIKSKPLKSCISSSNSEQLLICMHYTIVIRYQIFTIIATLVPLRI